MKDKVNARLFQIEKNHTIDFMDVESIYLDDSNMQIRIYTRTKHTYTIRPTGYRSHELGVNCNYTELVRKYNQLIKFWSEGKEINTFDEN